jgi:hypothetical protein
MTKQKKINKQVQNEIRALRAEQANQQTRISTLQAIVLSMKNTAPPTLPSQARLRKKGKPKTPENRTSHKSDSDSSNDKLHQIANLAQSQNLSIYQNNLSSSLEISHMETEDHQHIQQRLFNTSNIQDLSQEQYSFIEHQDEDETLANELIHWEDSQSEDKDSKSSKSVPLTQSDFQENIDLNNNGSGQGT